MEHTIKIEERGTPFVPFGFVYVDETRIGYSYDDDDQCVKVWYAVRWPTPSPSQVGAAVLALAAYLRSTGGK